jgi:hypothetical protein
VKEMNDLLANPKYNDALARLILFDDEFMTKVFENTDCFNLVLSIILKTKIRIQSSITQRFIKNLQGRSLQLDVFGMDEEGTCYNLEVQNKELSVLLKRSRYHSSLIDSNISYPGQKFENLKEIYIIFIVRKDYFRKMRDMYQIERMNVDDAVIVDDKEHIIIVNGEYDGDDEIGRLMHDFQCENPDDMYYEILRNRVRYFKEDEGGRQEMCAIWEEIRNDGVIEGRIQGELEGKIKGKIEGKLENTISTLLKLLTKKFGKTITIELQTEIENSDIETLNEVTEVIFDVENEEDVMKILHHI